MHEVELIFDIWYSLMHEAELIFDTGTVSCMKLNLSLIYGTVWWMKHFWYMVQSHSWSWTYHWYMVQSHAWSWTYLCYMVGTVSCIKLKFQISHRGSSNKYGFGQIWYLEYKKDLNTKCFCFCCLVRLYIFKSCIYSKYLIRLRPYSFVAPHDIFFPLTVRFGL